MPASVCMYVCMFNISATFVCCSFMFVNVSLFYVSKCRSFVLLLLRLILHRSLHRALFFVIVLPASGLEVETPRKTSRSRFSYIFNTSGNGGHLFNSHIFITF